MTRELPHRLIQLPIWVRNVSFLLIAAEIALAYLSLQLYQLVSLIQADSPVSESRLEKAEWIDRIGLWVGGAYAVVIIFCFLLGGIWTYRTSKNAAYLTPDQNRIRPGWAVGWHFIPFANLWKPYEAMRQAYNGSVSPARPLDAATPSFMRWWWAAFITGNIVASIASNLTDSQNLDTMKTGCVFGLINAPIAIAAILLWLKVVDTITIEQRNNTNVFA